MKAAPAPPAPRHQPGPQPHRTAVSANRLSGTGLVAPRLQAERAGVGASQLHQRRVGALLGDPAVAKDDDVVGLPDGAQAMGDEQAGAPPAEPPELLVDLVFSLR